MPNRTERQKRNERTIPIPLFREHPFKILSRDLPLVLSKAPYLLVVLWPLTIPAGITPPSSAGGFGGGFWPTVLQVVLLLGSVVGIATIVGGLFLAGPAFLISLSVTYAVFKLQTKYVQGKTVVWPTIKVDNGHHHNDETWISINGICTGQVLSSINFLSEAFQRPVIGVHNKTGGFLFDLLECIIQRDFGYTGVDGTIALYKLLKSALMDEKKKKVILIAHSQGGIIASLILDFLLADLPQEYLQKLEIFSFGCAANHFNSPLSIDGEPIVKHVEHYANEKDFVAQIGVLNWQVEAGRGAQQSAAAVKDKDDTRFYGSLFKRDFTGHLLIEHYFRYKLDPSADWPATATDGRPSRLWQYIGGKSPT